MGVIVGWSLAAVVAFVAFAYVAFSFDEGSVNAASLNRSLQYEYDSDYAVNDPHCRNVRPNSWICGVTDRPSGERVGYYDVDTSGSDWTATRRADGDSFFGKKSPETIESYVSSSEAREAGTDAGGLVWPLVAVFLFLLIVPGLVWLISVSKTNRSYDAPADMPPFKIGRTRPVGDKPEKPGS